MDSMDGLWMTYVKTRFVIYGEYMVPGKLQWLNPATEAWKSLVNKGDHPQMAAKFRLVKYHDLSRYIVCVWIIYGCGWYMFIYSRVIWTWWQFPIENRHWSVFSKQISHTNCLLGFEQSCQKTRNTCVCVCLILNDDPGLTWLLNVIV